MTGVVCRSRFIMVCCRSKIYYFKAKVIHIPQKLCDINIKLINKIYALCAGQWRTFNSFSERGGVLNISI